MLTYTVRVTQQSLWELVGDALSVVFQWKVKPWRLYLRFVLSDVLSQCREKDAKEGCKR